MRKTFCTLRLYGTKPDSEIREFLEGLVRSGVVITAVSRFEMYPRRHKVKQTVFVFWIDRSFDVWARLMFSNMVDEIEMHDEESFWRSRGLEITDE